MIAVSNITKRYAGEAVVDDVSFSIAAGRVTGFVGPNGAGKSTTMRIMVGLTRPDRGEVRYDGVTYGALRHPSRVVGSVLDAHSMHPGRTGRDHLRTLAPLVGVPVGSIDAVLAEVGLGAAADRRAGGYSLGMRQRLALAAALLGDPQVLLLDEPSNGLDPDGIRWLRTSLRDFARRGGTVFVSSHLIGELQSFADDLVVMGAGRLLTAEPVAAITARSTATVTVTTPHAGELARLLALQGHPVERSGDELRVTGTTTAAVSQLAFHHRLRLDALGESTQSLEDSLLQLTTPTAQYASA